MPKAKAWLQRIVSGGIGDRINTQIIAPLVEANARLSKSGFPDFNDPNKLGEGPAMVERLGNLIGIFQKPELDFSRNRAVLVMHGWGANAATMWPVVAPLHAAGYAVLLIDARCHGRSDGEAFTSMPRFAEDIAAGLAWLRTRSGIAGNRLALLGHSVGAGAALLHAAHHGDVCAVVSLSAFAHPREMMRRFMAGKRVPYPVIGWYVMRHVQRVIGATFDDIAPLATLPRVRCPVLLVHGRFDTTVPVDDARRLLATSAHATLMLVDADHDLREALAPHATDLVDFLQAACAALAASARQDGVNPDA